MKLNIYILLSFYLIDFSGCNKEKIPDCKPSPGSFPFGETISYYDSTGYVTIDFYNSGKAVIKDADDTTLLYIEGGYYYTLTSTASAYDISNSNHDPPSYVCVTTYYVRGGILISGMANAGCIGDTLIFYYRRFPGDSEFTLSGECFSCEIPWF